jgi:hypothetical protein
MDATLVMGCAVGAGEVYEAVWEFGLTPNWIARLEYLFARLRFAPGGLCSESTDV